jgi:hypothetical protein
MQPQLQLHNKTLLPRLPLMPDSTKPHQGLQHVLLRLLRHSAQGVKIMQSGSANPTIGAL